MRLYKVILIAVLLLAAGNASAQFLGQMSSADALDKSTGKIGGYLVAADGATAVVGSLRYGFSEYVEGRARLGFIDADNDDMNLILGADFKFQLWGYQQPDYPFNLALGSVFEFIDFDNGSLLGLGGSVIGSIPIELNTRQSTVNAKRRTIEPYGRFNLRMERRSVNDKSDTDLEFGFNLGAVFSVIDLVDFTAEFQFDEDTAFLIGIDILAF